MTRVYKVSGYIRNNGRRACGISEYTTNVAQTQLNYFCACITTTSSTAHRPAGSPTAAASATLPPPPPAPPPSAPAPPPLRRLAGRRRPTPPRWPLSPPAGWPGAARGAAARRLLPRASGLRERAALQTIQGTAIITWIPIGERRGGRLNQHCSTCASIEHKPQITVSATNAPAGLPAQRPARPVPPTATAAVSNTAATTAAQRSNARQQPTTAAAHLQVCQFGIARVQLRPEARQRGVRIASRAGHRPGGFRLRRLGLRLRLGRRRRRGGRVALCRRQLPLQGRLARSELFCGRLDLRSAKRRYARGSMNRS